ncbi:Uncharacterized protein Rs2_03010 [Raphanus sativus]|nr:Uncharacterized protein Rs2_03010 [Raphanus sativus]
MWRKPLSFMSLIHTHSKQIVLPHPMKVQVMIVLETRTTVLQKEQEQRQTNLDTFGVKQEREDAIRCKMYIRCESRKRKSKNIRNSLTKPGHSHYYDHDHEEENDEKEPEWHSEPGQPETLSHPEKLIFLHQRRSFHHGNFVFSLCLWIIPNPLNWSHYEISFVDTR